MLNQKKSDNCNFSFCHQDKANIANLRKKRSFLRFIVKKNLVPLFFFHTFFTYAFSAI